MNTQQQTTANKPTLILMMGLPASGKTSLAKQLSTRLNFIHVRSDELKAALSKDYSEIKKYHAFVYSALDYMTKTCLQSGHSVIYDSPFDRYELRMAKRRLAAEYGADCLVINIKIDKQTAIKRAEKRKNLYNWEDSAKTVVEKFDQQIEPPLEDERSLTVNGKDSLLSNTNKITKFLNTVKD